MKPLNIFWIAICLIILSGISKQSGLDYVSIAFLLGGILSIVVSISAWLWYDT